jgi:endonuclease/exonuclease/phosphatase family metal-dependent hydrolase
MMRKLMGFLLLLAAGGYFAIHNIEGLDQLKLRTPAAGQSQEEPFEAAPPVERKENTISVASFNIEVFGKTKSSKPAVMNYLADVARRFDIVAIQEIRAQSNDIVPAFVELINSTGRHYDFIIGPRLGRTSNKEQYAFIYDTGSIEADHGATYTVDDPDDLLHREPLVGWFRVRGPRPEEAFTFTLVNVHTDPDEVKTEVDALADAFVAVRSDGRGEDDTIMLGDFNANEKKLGKLAIISGMTATIVGTPTNTKGNKQFDNLLFTFPATKEFTGRGGVFDLVAEYNLTIDEAGQISDHFPVWAEFSIYEGGRPGRMATRSPRGNFERR